mmetsp:Transcript_10769/g.35681  ORF Transcript_10769/g.35681 Transcript_10769/m.35681 type:complete len:327 (-) Transcript_10769:119-1099(-)
MRNSEAATLEEDLAEAKRLFKASKRSRVKSLLAAFVRETTKTQLDLLTATTTEAKEDAKEAQEKPPEEDAKEAKKKTPEEDARKDDTSVRTRDIQGAKEEVSLKKGGRSSSSSSSDVGYVVVPSTPQRIEASAEVGRAIEWTNVTEYGWSQGGLADPWVEVSVAVEGATPESVTCDFGKDSFDLKVRHLGCKQYRFRRGALDRDLDPTKCKFVVKARRIVLKLRKRPAKTQKDGEPTRYPRWDDLFKRGGQKQKDLDRAPREPGSQYYDVVKNMYQNGNDHLRQQIGQVIERNRQREHDWGPDPLAPIIGDQDKLFIDKCNETFAE